MANRFNTSSFVENSQIWSWTLFRVLASAMFMTHGYTKLFGENPQPFRGSGMTSINIGELISFPIPLEINALFFAGTVEFFGGLLLALGLWTQLVALLAAALMLMTYLTLHLAWFPTINRGELAAMYFISFLLLVAYGGGPYSVDGWREVRRPGKMNN